MTLGDGLVRFGPEGDVVRVSWGGAGEVSGAAVVDAQGREGEGGGGCRAG